MSKAEFGQEFLCDFIALQGQIWEIAPDHICNVSLKDINVQEIIGGLDIGFRDATAFVVIATDGHNFYIIDEYIKSGRTTDAHAKEIKKMVDKYDIDFIYIDSSAAQTRFDLVMNYDISTINANKSVLDGIGYVASLVDNDRLFIDKKCRGCIDAFSNYRWDSRANLIKEKPVHDEHSHPADAIRYACYSHSYNIDTFELIEEEDAD